jgi:hypothetical protein
MSKLTLQVGNRRIETEGQGFEEEVSAQTVITYHWLQNDFDDGAEDLLEALRV